MKARQASLSVADLVKLFAEIGVAQDDALLDRDSRKFNRLYDQLKQIEYELKSRPGDERRALRSLLSHPNVQVQLNAAKATLVVAPTEARSVLAAIRNSAVGVQAIDAGSTLSRLDSGAYRPT